MSPKPIVVALGTVDAWGVAGTTGIAVAWAALGMAAPGTARALHLVFARTDPTFRRLDRVSRALVLATEAAGLAAVLSNPARDQTAIVIETTLGCLDTDLRFAQGLAKGIVDGPIFPYTLPSTCLGEVALRHRLRGPGVCLSIGGDDGGAAVWEAARLLAAGEASYALACRVDVLAEPQTTAPAICCASVALLAHAGSGAASVAPWPEGSANPFPRMLSVLPPVPHAVPKTTDRDSQVTS